MQLPGTAAAAAPDPRRFHWLLGPRRPRMNYAKGDFGDYLAMCALCALAVAVAYGPTAWPAWLGYALSGFLAVSFALRHGVAARVPLLLRRPHEFAYLLAHKLANLPALAVVALALLLAENALIELTPGWPHHTALMRTIGLVLFWLHAGGILAYRTVSLVDHWRKHALVSEVLLQSPWKNVGFVRRNIRYEIVHAYVTGVLAHLVLLAPWYFVLTRLQYSVLLVPLTCAASVLIHMRFLRRLNAWFYRDHWLGHNAEADFVYLHGTHHDAIPAGMIAVGGAGILEGLLRHAVGYPTPFYNPLTAFIAYTLEIKSDIDAHQFIPGIYPRMSMDFRRVGQHSIHHFGHLEPFGFGMKLDLPGLPERFVRGFDHLPEEFRNSARLDEQLNGFEWNNARYEWFLELCRKYE